MPEMSGLDLLASTQKIPFVVLITSQKDYAVKAFEHDVDDYLLKPVEYVRFHKSVNRILDKAIQNKEVQAEDDFIFVKSELKYVKIYYNKILFIEAMADYVLINTEDCKHIVHGTMKGIEKKLKPENFMRIHRSYIVNMDKIESIDSTIISIRDHQLPVGASYKNEFMKKLKIL
jgi:DNA-binding LytR/AlgR family response regulator